MNPIERIGPDGVRPVEPVRRAVRRADDQPQRDPHDDEREQAPRDERRDDGDDADGHVDVLV